MNRYRHFLVILTIFTFVFMVGCSTTTPTTSLEEVYVPSVAPASTEVPTTVAAAPEPIELLDGLQRMVKLSAPAQRVISLAPSNTEILFAVGAGLQVVGRDSFSDFPPEAQSIALVGDTQKYNLEQITALQPDLVLASELNSTDLVKSLENLNLTVYYLPNPVDLDGLYANLATVARLTGHEQDAANLTADLKGRVEQVTKALENVSDRPRVFYELDGTDPARPWTPGKNSFHTRLIQMAGGENITADLDTWAQLSQEELLVRDPDIILMGDAMFGMTVEQLSSRPGWNQLKAVKENRVLPFDDNLMSRPSPRLVDGLVALAKLLHPDLAADLK